VKDLPADVLAQWRSLPVLPPDSFLKPIGLSIPPAKRSVVDRATHLAPDLRYQRDRRWLHRRGFEDGDSGGGVRQISFRLVEGQVPDKIRKAFRDYVTARCPEIAGPSSPTIQPPAAIALGLEHEALAAARRR